MSPLQLTHFFIVKNEVLAEVTIAGKKDHFGKHLSPHAFCVKRR